MFTNPRYTIATCDCSNCLSRPSACMDNKKLENRAEERFSWENIAFRMKACVLIVEMNYGGKFDSRS